MTPTQEMKKTIREAKDKKFKWVEGDELKKVEKAIKEGFEIGEKWMDEQTHPTQERTLNEKWAYARQEMLKPSHQSCKHNKTLEKGWRCVDCDYEKLFKPSKNRSKLDSTKKNSIKGIK